MFIHGKVPPVVTALVIFLITYGFIGLRRIPRSVANLIVAQQAKRRVEIGFMEYFRVGAVITAATLAIGILVLAFEVRMAQGAEGKYQKPETVTVTPSGQSGVSRTFRAVVLCDTPEARARGLQGFRPLTPGEAALFIFDKPETVTFWMGSVAYPIDIVFVGPGKKAIRVHRDCKPGSRNLYPSGRPAAWAIETAAGSGIKAGDGIKIE